MEFYKILRQTLLFIIVKPVWKNDTAWIDIEHITPVLKSLHWLTIRYRIRFKILLLTYKCINGLAPGYLSSLVAPYKPKRLLRSSTQCRLEIQNGRLKSQGDRSFRVVSQKEWNQLPLDIKLAPSVDSFKTKLKTFLFKECFG